MSKKNTKLIEKLVIQAVRNAFIQGHIDEKDLHNIKVENNLEVI